MWLLIVGVEILHGIGRRLFLEPRVGDLRSRQIGVATGSMLILIITFFSLPSLGTVTTWDLLLVGLLWVMLMLPFEIIVGRLTGASWEGIGSDYDLRRGGLMPIGLVILLLAPMLMAFIPGR